MSGWAEAVRRAVIAVPPLNDAFDSFIQAAAEVNSLPLESAPLLDFLCTSLEECEEVAGVIGATAEGLTE